jgi:hypothetical protein
MDRESRDSRHYAVSPLPTLREGAHISNNKDLVLKLYEQVCSTWKEMVGVRFKLLALVPTVSLALLATVLSTKGLSEGLTRSGKGIIVLLGLISTFGLYVYDVRNSVLHDDLISRARKIEDELGVDTGLFRGRLNAHGLFRHGVATKTIYFSAMLAWGAALMLIVTY